jgi:hypothetical protein
MTALAATAWYTYAVLPGGTRAPNGDEAVLQGASLEIIAQNDGPGALAALVSLVPRGLFAPDDAACRAAEPDWVAARAQAHHAVVAQISAAGPCLPLGFGTLFASTDSVRRWLDTHAAGLRLALGQLGGQQEWAVSLIEDEAAHVAWLQENSVDLRRLAEAAQRAGPGAAFLLQKRMEKAVGGARQAHAAAVAARLGAHFAALHQTRGEAAPVGAAAAWSLLAGREDALPEMIDEARGDLAHTGLTLRVTGPWPPYAFARAFWQEAQNA